MINGVNILNRCYPSLIGLVSFNVLFSKFAYIFFSWQCEYSTVHSLSFSRPFHQCKCIQHSQFNFLLGKIKIITYTVHTLSLCSETLASLITICWVTIKIHYFASEPLVLWIILQFFLLYIFPVFLLFFHLERLQMKVFVDKT